MTPARVAGWVILAIGSLQAIGFVTGFAPLRQIGALTAASPLPLVFSSFRGMETFSSTFAVAAVDDTGAKAHLDVTPAVYGQFGGPYNRRNVYGAVFSYGPKLTLGHEPQLVQSVLQYAYCNHGPLAAALPLGGKIKQADVVVTAGNAGATEGWTLEVACP